MPVPKQTLWVLVADGGRARILVNSGVGKGLHPASGEAFGIDNPPTREQGTDRPGRTFDSAGSGRHAMEPRVDWHRFEKVKFSREIAQRLDRAALDGAFDRLILIAPPATLGDLRSALDGKTRQKVVGEIAKDLTQLSDRDIEGHLDGVAVV